MIVASLEELVFLVEDAENSLQRPDTCQQFCHHKVAPSTCTQSRRFNFPCPSSEDLRYAMTRITVDGIDLYLVEAGGALSLQVGGLFGLLSFCLLSVFISLSVDLLESSSFYVCLLSVCVSFLSIVCF